MRLTWGVVLFLIASACVREPPELPPTSVVPSPEQLAYQEMELAGFIHFSINTFTDREWGFGDESPELFAPSDLDPDQWARVAAEVGMGELILTAKHHDGFALWPSKTTTHSIAHSPWRGGEGDLVQEFAEAARKRGLKVGLYLSPWDRNHPQYGGPLYLEAFRAQLRELLTGYGEITEIWVDGANGGTGYYGGANEERRIDRTTYYQWPETMGIVKSLQPSTLIFSDAGPDIRWIGNERGFAGETNWSTINTPNIVIGEADTDYLNHGDPDGSSWVVPLCDTSIRPGWFYHAAEDTRVKTPAELVELYMQSVGRGASLLLNLPPDRRGRVHETDSASLCAFRMALEATFSRDIAREATATGGVQPATPGPCPPGHAIDGDAETFWCAPGLAQPEMVLEFRREVRFDTVRLREYLPLGQRVDEWALDARQDGAWRENSKRSASALLYPDNITFTGEL